MKKKLKKISLFAGLLGLCGAFGLSLFLLDHKKAESTYAVYNVDLDNTICLPLSEVNYPQQSNISLSDITDFSFDKHYDFTNQVQLSNDIVYLANTDIRIQVLSNPDYVRKSVKFIFNIPMVNTRTNTFNITSGSSGYFQFDDIFDILDSNGFASPLYFTWDFRVITSTQFAFRIKMYYQTQEYISSYNTLFTSTHGLSNPLVLGNKNIFISCYQIRDYVSGFQIGYSNGYTYGATQFNQSIEEAFNNGYQAGYDYGTSTATDFYESSMEVVRQNAYNVGYGDGYDIGFVDGVNSQGQEILDSYQEGYVDGYNEGTSQDSAVTSIFSGILQVAMVPVNFFLAIFNFEILGINLSGFIRALFTIAITIIVIRTIFGGKGASDS